MDEHTQNCDEAIKHMHETGMCFCYGQDGVFYTIGECRQVVQDYWKDYWEKQKLCK